MKNEQMVLCVIHLVRSLHAVECAINVRMGLMDIMDDNAMQGIGMTSHNVRKRNFLLFDGSFLIKTVK